MWLLLSADGPPPLLKRLLAGFTVGVLIGTAVMLLAVGRRVETLYLQQRDLVAQLDRYRNQVENLSQQPPRGSAVIESVEIGWLEFRDAGGRRQLELEQAVTAHLDRLVGKRIDQIDPLLILHVVEGRTYTFGRTRYRLKARAVILSRQTRILVAVETEDVNPKDSD